MLWVIWPVSVSILDPARSGLKIATTAKHEFCMSAENHVKRESMEQRDALFRQFSYDANASLRFILAHLLPLPGDVLEIGMGPGRVRAALARHADRLTVLDLDLQQQHIATININHPGQRQRIRCMIQDGRLPWESGSFDSVVTVNSLHLLARPHEMLQELIRLVKPGGKLVLCDLSVRGCRLFDWLQRSEGRGPCALANGLAELSPVLRRPGWKIKRFRGCNQELVIAVAPIAPAQTQGHT
jgi:SAM-dependent methyltransferase